MSVGIIVFARLASSRLPGKSLLPVGGRPLVGHVLDRARRVRLADRVVLATSTDPSDDPLMQFGESDGVHVYRGSLENVAQRALDCARENGWTAFARVCGDRPFFEPEDVDRAIACMAGGDQSIDLVTNRLAGPVPPGLTTEVVRTDALEKALELTTDPRDLEHVTTYLYAHPDQFRLVGITVWESGEQLRFVVDTEEDLRRARHIVSQLVEPAAASVDEVAALARAWDRAASEAGNA